MVYKLHFRLRSYGTTKPWGEDEHAHNLMVKRAGALVINGVR